MSKQTTALSKPMSDEVREQLDAAFPQEASALRIQLPRFAMVSQDVTEEVKNPKTGKKEINVVTEAGMFFTEHQTDELDENGKKKWDHEEIGMEVPEIIILFERKQLRHYDSANKQYTSSPIYDNADEILPLWKDKKEVARGTPAELRTLPQFQGLTAAGQPTSKLEENRILFVRYNGEDYQWTVRGSSMYEWLKYKKTTKPNQVVTALGSEAKQNGSTAWNQTTFKAVRPLDRDESEEILAKVMDIQKAISIEKESYARVTAAKSAADKEFDAIPSSEEKKKGKNKPF